ncbi:pantothenate synthetase [Kordiimonas sediminis]|uniref:Pantothenate synthetase n=1 Tax=Kordiimonas sediminis TaxID=1735581 RepID=A0A919ATL6_9PROT|nr:pantoate--beta-alanine ligase [Kordiimonas sediminis]GHF24699.1 pantothenate synthetase [Kordiimonas sediminis]
MTAVIPVVRTIDDLRRIVSDWRQNGFRVGLVPTMGALHDGHLSLVHEISKKVDKVIVSIFVNPKQFGEGEDFDTYPRTEGSDRQKLAMTSADLVFAPPASEMYGHGFSTNVTVSGLSTVLEGANRPGHFDGVALIVTKLLLAALPDVAIFGEKDYQQLCVIKRFVADLNIPTEVIGAPLFREEDGLAASSRNAYLEPEERRIANSLYKALKQLCANARKGGDLRAEENRATEAVLKAGFQKVDYISIVDPETLEVLEKLDRPARVIAVARLGKVRLLDNMAI